MAIDLLVRGGKVVTSREVFQADVAIANGRVEKLLRPGSPCRSASVLDAGDLYVMPGLIDAHVHLREPGLVDKEDIASGTMAAACGGVTTVLDMPNTLPPVESAPILAAKAELIRGKAYVDVGLFALLSTGSARQINALIDAGCVGFKLFLGPTTGNLAAPSWGELLEIFSHMAGTEVPIVVHAENREVIEYWLPKAKRVGEGYDSFLASRPEFGEVAATAQVCRLAGATGTSVHIAHLALKDAVEVVRQARMAGWPVTAEACIPHLFLTADDYEIVGAAMKVLPPVRHRADQEALWQGLARGDIDIIATDHAPHLESDKEGPAWDAAAGAPGVETLLPLLLERARQGSYTLSDIARWCAAAPAARFGLEGKGCIKPGAWADLVLVDLGKEWVLEGKNLHSRCRTIPFEGRTGYGAPVLTLLRGRVVAQEGQVVGNPTGSWVRPTP